MQTIVITPKSKSNFDLLIVLLKKLGEKVNIIDDEASDKILLNKMKKNRKKDYLSNNETLGFLSELNAIAGHEV